MSQNLIYHHGITIKAGTDYGTCSAAQLDTAAKNMMFASVDSQQTCREHAMNMFRSRAVLPQNEPKIVGFQDEHKGIPCPRMLVRPSHGGSLCHKHFFANFRTSCSWLCRRTRFLVCTGLNKNALWNMKSASHCNYESVEPTKTTETIFDIISTFGTIQPWSEPTFLFSFLEITKSIISAQAWQKKREITT